MSSGGIKQSAIWRKAATSNSSQNGNNEETAASAEGTNRNPSATTTAPIRTRKMKTQIAKQVYDSSTKKLNRDVVVNENEPPPVVGMEFQKKREDRDREVKEIQEMLNEITNTPTKEKTHEYDGKQEMKEEKEHQNVQKPIQRSKTEINLRQTTAARRSQLRLVSVRSKSAHATEKENASPNQKQKTYNSSEARRYMQEQRKKRKAFQTVAQAAEGKPPIDRNEIKKRLDNLRANTRKIVDKNVKMAKKKALTTPDSLTKVENIPKVVEKHLEPEAPKVEVWSDRPPKRKLTEEKQQQDHSPLVENYIKVGLLRKPEIKDHSFSAIKDLNLDKENLILDILSPPLSDIPALRLCEPDAVEADKPDFLSSEKRSISFEIEPIRSLEHSKKPTRSSRSSKTNSIAELNLRVPEAKLESRKSMREKSIQVDESANKPQEKNAQLPYWLKPTAVQAYPYNFIMAVRKKLEAIANPPAIASSSSYTDHHSKKRHTDTPETHASNNVKRSLLDNEEKSLTKSLEQHPLNRDNFKEHQLSKSLSGVTSNFSSISIQMPESNTHSSLKSKSQKRILEQRKPLQVDDDDTTVSSSVFSSPEKKKNIQDQAQEVEPLSPLSVQNVSNMHVMSRSQTKNITLNRGDAFGDTGALSSRSEGSVDFSQLLNDFNRSLSQVIEVNHQLKTTLVKSHEIFSPQKSKRSSVADLKSSITSSRHLDLAEYVSDFEESSYSDDKHTKNPNETPRTSSSIPEVPTASRKSSATNTPKSSSSNPEIPQEESPAQSSAEEMQSRSPASLGTQTFVVSSPKTQTIHEEPPIEESPNKENMSANQYSRDSLELSLREDYIKSHVNTSRGDYQIEESEPSAGPPPSYKVTSKSQHSCDRSETNLINSSLDSEFVHVFNKSEISVLSLNRSLSESTVNYSSIGLYEKLIQNETSKSEHLAALLRMREKAIIDRTKGQIAWLEVQKERYKAKGLTIQISTVKKKQRGILMKMEKEREEIKKLLQQTKVQRDHKLRIPEIRPSTDVTFLQQRRAGVHQTSTVLQASPLSYQQQQQKQSHQNYNQQQSARSKSSAIVRGYELETSRSLEQLLQKREEDLRRRREHVERLMEWHRRLDQEEAEVLQLEQMLLDYNNAHVHQEESDRSASKMEKKLKEIDRSLRELNSISGVEISADAQAGDFVRTTGSKLNKLWRRLTSQRTEKFEPNRRYKLCKGDLEQLYEEAKLAVLNDFGENTSQMEVFLGQTSISTTQQSTLIAEVPQLNLNFSSGQSDADLVRGNYSPGAAEEEYLGCAGASSSSSKEVHSEESERESNSNSKRKTRCGTTFLSTLPLLPEDNRSLHSETRIDKNLPKSSESPSISVPNIASTTKTFHTDSNGNSFTSNVGSAAKDDTSYKSLSENVTNRSNACNSQNGLLECALISKKSRPSVIQSVSDASNCVQAISTQRSAIFSAYDTDAKASIKEKCTQYSTNEGTSTPNLFSTSESVCEIPSESYLRSAESDDTSHVQTSSSQHQSDSSEKQNHSINEDHFSKSQNSSTKSFPIGSSSSAPNCSRTSIEISNNVEEEIHQTTLRDDLINSVSHMKTGSILNESQTKALNSSTKLSDVQNCDATEEISDSILPQSRLSTNCSVDVESVSMRLEFSATNGSSKSSETLQHSGQECVSAAYTRNSTPASNVDPVRSEMKFDSNIASSAEEMSLESYFSTRANQEYTSVMVQRQSSSSSIESLIPQFSTSSTSENELNEETAATLRSIKSIDNSTNSKHSSDKLTASSSGNADQSAKAISSVIGSHQDAIDKSLNQSYSSAFESETDSNSSHQLQSTLTTSKREQRDTEDDPKIIGNAFYETDFTDDTETNIDDLSLPKFETTAEEDQFNESQLNNSISPSKSNTTDLERRLIDLDVSLKDLDATFEKALSPEKSLSPPCENSIKKTQQQKSEEQTDSSLMPDIISEVELRRRQQVMLENDMKQFEHAVPYMYVREIPNKPPPPYVPPAHGSPMTTIFPSEERIKDITYRRTKELYYEILNIDATDESGRKPPSVLDENITNIYERIILDICKEYLTEYESVLSSTDPNNFHSQLAFFNPPDRLKCMQDFIYKEVRKSLAMDKNSPKRNQAYSVYGHRGKRDHIGEIIIQEMFEEDDRWSNFYVEEGEVLELIIDEMIGGAVMDIATAVLDEEGELLAAADHIAL